MTVIRISVNVLTTLSIAEWKEGSVVGSQIRSLMNYKVFEATNIVTCFAILKNHKHPDDWNIVANIKKLWCNMRIKLNFLYSHLDFFLENFGEEQIERFHQDIKNVETRYQNP